MDAAKNMAVINIIATIIGGITSAMLAQLWFHFIVTSVIIYVICIFFPKIQIHRVSPNKFPINEQFMSTKMVYFLFFKFTTHFIPSNIIAFSKI